VAISQHGTSVLLTSHPQDGLVVNLYIPHNQRMPLQAEEALGPISIPRGSCGVDPFQRTSASRAEKPGAYSTPGTPSFWTYITFKQFHLSVLINTCRYISLVLGFPN